MISQLWHRLFLEERPSLSLSLFRITAALTTGLHVFPSLVHLSDNYCPTAFKTYNLNFFPLGFVEKVQQSPEGLIVFFCFLFCISCIFLLIGLLSQWSCLLMTLSCYYFYALNSYHIGTLSWDILLVTLFLLCLTPYPGDYFSVDCLRGKDLNAYQRKRPFFLQRLLQCQIGFNFFYTSLYKILGEGNWLKDKPLYYLLNYPPEGVTKHFLFKEYFASHPQLCYLLGLIIFTLEFFLIFLLFWPVTRRSAILLGIFFHFVLILTLDVPAIFFFLFPPQLLLFINPQKVLNWIEEKRCLNEISHRHLLLFDGRCQFCLSIIRKVKIMDLWNVIKPINCHEIDDLKVIHPDLTQEKVASQIHLVDPSQRLFKGFEVFRRLCLKLPMMYPLLVLFYFPGLGLIGPMVYRIVAENRYLLHLNPVCKINACFRKPKTAI